MILDSRGAETASGVTSITDRQQAKLMAQNATIGECNDIAYRHAVAATNHLGNQIPALLHKVVSEAITGFYHSLLARQMLVVAPGTNPLQEFEDAQRAAHSDGTGSSGERAAGSVGASRSEGERAAESDVGSGAEQGPEPSGADGPGEEAPAEAVAEPVGPPSDTPGAV